MFGGGRDDLSELVARARASAGGATAVASDIDEDEHPCVECGRVIGSAGRWHADASGALVPYCASCVVVGA
jgi:hypothetical protein